MRRLLGQRQLGMNGDAAVDARRLMIFTEHFNATYFISFDIPLRFMREQGKVQLRAFSQQDVMASGSKGWRSWIDEFRPEIVFMTRYGDVSGVDIVRDCKVRGIPVVYHIDDDLLDLPSSLGVEINKRQGAAVEARRTMLGEVDLIYASTAMLADVMRRHFPGQRIFHGIYASYRPIKPHIVNLDRPVIIGYMGSKGHREDLDLVVPSLVRLMHERPTLQFETFGTIQMPELMQQFGSRVRHYNVQKSYSDFLQTLASLGWHLGLAPLVDEPFNRCKAPTKYIEYTSCGIPVVASDVVVYAGAITEGAGMLVREDWYGAIASLLDDPQVRATQLDTAKAHCAVAFAPEALEAQIMGLIGKESL